MTASPSPETRTDAILRANELTGLDTIAESIVAHEGVITNDRTPFLHTQYENRKAWRIEYDGVSLTKLESDMRLPSDPYADQRMFIVFIGGQDGHLLKVISTFRGAAGEMRPAPSAASAESQLRSTEEIYTGLPNEDPKVTFVEALRDVLRRGLVNPVLAKEMDAVYVMDSRLSAPARAVWVISLRGIPPTQAIGGSGREEIPEWQRNHMRCAVDGATGRVLFGTNVPQPVN